MANIPKDPLRRCLPVDAWPPADRAAWRAALATASDILEEAGAAAHWSANSRRSVAQAYGRWLTFLQARGSLDPDAGPADRPTRARVEAYVDLLEASLSPVTVAGRLRDLVEALRVMDPEAELAWLRRAQRRLTVRARPVRDKTTRLRPARELYRLGLSLMDRARQDTATRPRWQSARYRDGLMIAVLAAVPIRLQTFTELEPGCSLRPVDGIYWIRLAPGATKNGHPFEAPLPVELTPRIDTYLETHRPRLLGGRDSTRLWISWQATELTANTIATRVRQATARAFGTPVNPHLFRDCAATSLAVEDPDHVHAAASILQHRSLRPTLRHYNQARQLQAQRVYCEAIERKRGRLR